MFSENHKTACVRAGIKKNGSLGCAAQKNSYGFWEGILIPKQNLCTARIIAILVGILTKGRAVL